MNGMKSRLVVAIAGVLLLSAHVEVQSGEDARRPASKQWPAVSGDWGNTRHSMLNQITTQNISKLGAAWTSQKFDTPAGARTMPVVHDGLIFVTAPPSVYALDAKTGARVWRFQAGPQSGMGAPAREGVAVGDGLVFVGLSDARVIALREKTGELVWNKYVGDKARDKGQVISGRAALCRGLVSVGLSADNGWRGQVVAMDGKTGEEAWRFFVVPAPGEPGSETWPKNSRSGSEAAAPYGSSARRIPTRGSSTTSLATVCHNSLGKGGRGRISICAQSWRST